MDQPCCGDVHVTPLNDLREHTDRRDCWCWPEVRYEPGDLAAVVVHQSADGRELVERHGVN
jgi:hypothetical protein